MRGIVLNLPGTGRGTMRSMVEGSVEAGLFNRAASLAAPDPSTAYGGPPPRSGEVLP
jgi:hypothetical protein